MQCSLVTYPSIIRSNFSGSQTAPRLQSKCTGFPAPFSLSRKAGHQRNFDCAFCASALVSVTIIYIEIYILSAASKNDLNDANKMASHTVELPAELPEVLEQV
jgi:hypothetical protein